MSIQFLARVLGKPWVAATIGSALIVLSTFITGSMGYKIQNEIDDMRAQLADLRLKEEDSRDESSQAELLNSIDRLTRNELPSFTSPFEMRMYALTEEASLHSRRNRLLTRVAAIRGEQIPELLLSPLPESLDDYPSVINKFVDLEVELIEKAAAYRTGLIEQTTDRILRLRRAQESRNWLSLIALLTQVLGLVFLLLKEVSPGAGTLINANRPSGTGTAERSTQHQQSKPTFE